jgi:peroxiredoxin
LIPGSAIRVHALNRGSVWSKDALRAAARRSNNEIHSGRAKALLMRTAISLLRTSLVTSGLLLAGAVFAHGAKFNRKVDVGSPAPNWAGLAGVDGRKHSLGDYKSAKILVIAFTSNECPVSQLYEERFTRFVNQHKRQGVVFVAINCSVLAPDRLEKMKERSARQHYNFDYLADPTQATGREYGATVTPQLFVLDRNRNIAYMGNFDDNIELDQVKKEYVEKAVTALLAGKKPDPTETRATGCGIEYGKPQEATKGSLDNDSQ